MEIDPRFYGEARLLCALAVMDGSRLLKKLRFNEIVDECLQWGRMTLPHNVTFDRTAMVEIIKSYNSNDEYLSRSGHFNPQDYAWMEAKP